MGRLISTRARPGEHQQFLAMAFAKLLAHLVPEVGIDSRTALDLLGRARDVDRGGDQFPVTVPEEEYLDAVVLVALDPPERRLVRAAVHLRVAIGVDGTAVLGHHGMPQAPTDKPRPAILPGARRDQSETVDQEGTILGGPEHTLLRELVHPVEQIRRRVRVGGIEDQLSRVEAGDPPLQSLANRFENLVPDHHEIARDQDRLVDHAISFSRFERQCRRSHWTFDTRGDPRVHLPRQRDRPVGRDAHRRPADVQLRRLGLLDNRGQEHGHENQNAAHLIDPQ